MSFLPRLKRALCGNTSASLVFIGNFEVEDRWAEGEFGLPSFAFGTSGAIVDRMDEFVLLLAGENDAVVLKGEPEPDYLAYLAHLGLDLPEILCVHHGDPGRIVTADALADQALLDRLRKLATTGARLLPHGVSVLEEQLSAATGMPIAGSSAAVCKTVNSKIYSRRLADHLRLRQPIGWTCTSVTEWRSAVDHARVMLRAGVAVAVKDAFGVSGKGIVVLRTEGMLRQLDHKIRSRAQRHADDRLSLVVEAWVNKRADLNYQVTVGTDATVRFDFVKEALTVNGVHKGHQIPAELSAAQHDEIRAAGDAIGRQLEADGYHGIVGVDALVHEDGSLFPVIEINARSNMSTYQLRLQEAFLPDDRAALARQYPLRLGRRVPFAEARSALKDLLLTRTSGTGVIIHNFATLNAAARDAGPFDGRLYALLIADTVVRAHAMDNEVTHRLAGLAEGSKI